MIHTATSNTETVRKLKKIFDGFRDAAKTYSEVTYQMVLNDLMVIIIFCLGGLFEQCWTLSLPGSISGSTALKSEQTSDQPWT